MGASVLLAVLALPLAAVALAVRLGGPGPILFRQHRYGRDGRVFRIYKFRTMRGTVPCAAAIGDPADHAARITPVGGWLRRHCVDELPQLINVVRGDMSLVGPRAHPVDLHVAGTLYEDLLPHYHRRHAVRPGMTGLAQVNGYVGIVDTVEHARQRLDHDLRYIALRGLRLDLAVLAFTAWRLLARGGRGTPAFPLHRLRSTGAVPAAHPDPGGTAPGPRAPSLRAHGGRPSFEG